MPEVGIPLYCSNEHLRTQWKEALYVNINEREPMGDCWLSIQRGGEETYGFQESVETTGNSEFLWLSGISRSVDMMYYQLVMSI